jgi:hypothetical protein
MKKRQMRIGLGCVLGVIGLLLAFTSDSKAQVRNDFSNASLNDRYGYHVIALHSNGRPFAFSGYCRFNGDGTLSGKDTASTDSPDTIKERVYTGTYHVNPDGTGTLQWNFTSGFSPIGNITIVDGGRRIEIIFAVESNMNAFSLIKQNVP